MSYGIAASDWGCIAFLNVVVTIEVTPENGIVFIDRELRSVWLPLDE